MPFSDEHLRRLTAMPQAPCRRSLRACRLAVVVLVVIVVVGVGMVWWAAPVQLAMPVIPDIVQQQGVAVKKKSPSIMMIVNLMRAADAATSARFGLRPHQAPTPASRGPGTGRAPAPRPAA